MIRDLSRRLIEIKGLKKEGARRGARSEGR